MATALQATLLAKVAKKKGELEDEKDKEKFHNILEEKVLAKNHVELGEDFISLTVICYLKETRKELLINNHK